VSGQPLDIEHIIPQPAGGPTVEENLWLSYGPCNYRKGKRTTAVDPSTKQRVPLFDPRRQIWSGPFASVGGGTLVQGKAPTGRATVAALQLNR
jgi:hypothetical protein